MVIKSIQCSLFNEPDAIPEIDGLGYITNYVTPELEVELLRTIDKQPWLTDLKRRVQHYGWKYDYKARGTDESQRLGDLPVWLATYANQLCERGHFTMPPNTAIINEYLLGQGIAAHTDKTAPFGDTVASLSLGSPCVMEFTPPPDHPVFKSKLPILLEPRSLLILTGEARYQWQHAIPKRKTDRIHGQVIERCRRVSLTFRVKLYPSQALNH